MPCRTITAQYDYVFRVFSGHLTEKQIHAHRAAIRHDKKGLLAVYEASHDRNDFIRADVEFKKLFESGKYTRDDVRMYGVLNEYQMYDCRDIALRQY